MPIVFTRAKTHYRLIIFASFHDTHRKTILESNFKLSLWGLKGIFKVSDPVSQKKIQGPQSFVELVSFCLGEWNTFWNNGNPKKLCAQFLFNFKKLYLIEGIWISSVFGAIYKHLLIYIFHIILFCFCISNFSLG